MEQKLSRTTRALCRTRIVLYKLIVIAALNLLPLLTWHNATMHFFEDYHMGNSLKGALMQAQLGSGKTLLWIAVWILVPIDIANGLRCLGQRQDVLHPRVCKSEPGEDTAPLDSAHDTTTKGSTKRFRYVEYAPHVLLSKPGRLILSLSYDMTMLLVLAFHVYVYFNLRAPSQAICDTVDPDLFSQQNEMHISEKFSDRDKCMRYNLNFFIAGYFSSCMAGLLATFHLAAILCTLVEIIQGWIYNDDGEDDDKSDCHDVQRYVDIRTRDIGTFRTTGRLTDISEEEHCAGSGTRTRRRTNRSKNSDGQQSKASSGGSSRLEEVLLECLVE